ncbi:STAS domain-containing protein [Siccirubricoccus deserti]
MTAAAAAGPAAEPATLEARPDGAALRLSFRGTLDTAAVSRLWATTGRDAARAKSLILDLAGVTALDTSGAAFLLHLERQAAKTSWQGLTDARVQAVLDRTRQALAQPPPQPPPSLPFLGHIGQATVQTGRNMLGGVAFLGEVLVASLGILRRPWRLRLPELLRHLDEAGLRAFGLTALLGVLIGLILAFQSSIPMRQSAPRSSSPTSSASRCCGSWGR